jgi:hypothetical protein
VNIHATEGASGASSKINLENTYMNKPYSGSSYKASEALNNKLSLTKKGIGNYWRAGFKLGKRLVEKVRVRNRDSSG